MKKLPLSGKRGTGKYTLLDDEDAKYFEEKNIKLRLSNEGYVVFGGNKTAAHRVITKAPKGMVVDHINHNTVDNRKENLRICTYQQNQMNRRYTKGSSSIHKGVSWSKHKKKWEAYITINGKQKHIGVFTDEHEAAKAYNKAAKELFGEFAYLNDIK